MTPSKCLCLMVAVLVWASLTLSTIHELDHLAGQDDDEICLQCLAASGLDQSLTANLPAVPIVFPQYHSPVRLNSISFAEQTRSVSARGPPLSYL